MKLALGLDVQTNAKGGKFMSIEDSHQGALVCKVDVEVLATSRTPKRVGMCFATNTDLELWTEEVEQGVIDNIIFQKPFPGTWLRAEMPNTMWSQRQTPRSSIAASETFGNQPGPTYGNRLRQDCLASQQPSTKPRSGSTPSTGSTRQPVAPAAHHVHADVRAVLCARLRLKGSGRTP